MAKVVLEVAQASFDGAGTTGSGMPNLRLFRNGTLVKAWRGELKAGEDGVARFSASIPLVSGTNRVTAYAFNRDNIRSAEAVQEIEMNAAPDKGKPMF